MTVLNPNHWSVGGVVLATYASWLESIDGLDNTPPRKAGRVVDAMYRHGVAGNVDIWDQAKIIPFRIGVAPWDDDGDVTYPNVDAHLRANLDGLLGVLHPPRGRTVTIEREEYNTSGTLVTWSAEARNVGGTVVAGTRKRIVTARLELPYPRWHIGAEVVRTAASSHTFTPAGNASIADMILTFAGAGTMVHDETGDTITTTGACTVNVGARTVGATATTNDRRNRARFNRGWWQEWFPGEEVNLTVTGTTVAVSYYNAGH